MKALVGAAMSMSLDGFVAGAGDGPRRPLGKGGEALFDWYFHGGETLSRLYPDFRLSRASANVFDERVARTAAVICGRRTYDVAKAWGGKGPRPGAPLFVLTHRPPRRAPEGADYTFVRDIRKAVAQARARVRGPGMVMVMGGMAIQAALKAGLLDEIEIDLVPVLLAKGVPLFDAPPAKQLQLMRVVEAPGVTHLRYRVR